MKAKTILAAALAAALTLTTVRGADITPAEFKTISEEGLIYGLPIVMNYAVMYDYAVDKNSGQYKAPFNHIKNEARVFTYKDTAIVTPNSDTPYSMLWLDLRAEPIVLSVPAVDTGTSAAGLPAMTQATTWLSAPIGKVRPPQASRRCSAPPRNFPLWRTALSFSIRKTCPTW
jgi:hypothetical protein